MNSEKTIVLEGAVDGASRNDVPRRTCEHECMVSHTFPERCANVSLAFAVSYGDISIFTRSPMLRLMKRLRIFPEKCAKPCIRVHKCDAEHRSWKHHQRHPLARSSSQNS